mmetsp:Transcript_100235/g.278956  ORF Transcript_100235/g.278956 Transcript_100235/m.278956 type:complete len:386 (+) Transcript_100235:654-1811(+)
MGMGCSGAKHVDLGVIGECARVQRRINVGLGAHHVHLDGAIAEGRGGAKAVAAAAATARTGAARAAGGALRRLCRRGVRDGQQAANCGHVARGAVGLNLGLTGASRLAVVVGAVRVGARQLGGHLVLLLLARQLAVGGALHVGAFKVRRGGGEVHAQGLGAHLGDHGAKAQQCRQVQRRQLGRRAAAARQHGALDGRASNAVRQTIKKVQQLRVQLDVVAHELHHLLRGAVEAFSKVVPDDLVKDVVHAAQAVVRFHVLRKDEAAFAALAFAAGRGAAHPQDGAHAAAALCARLALAVALVVVLVVAATGCAGGGGVVVLLRIVAAGALVRHHGAQRRRSKLECHGRVPRHGRGRLCSGLHNRVFLLFLAALQAPGKLGRRTDAV